jgi:hypothetical protein
VYEAIAVTRLDDARAVAAGADVIGVDEGQFVCTRIRRD